MKLLIFSDSHLYDQFEEKKLGFSKQLSQMPIE